DEFSRRTTQRRDSTGTESPSRVTETRSQDGKTRTQVIESPDIEGRYRPLLEREEETIQVDAQTTRVVVKEYGRNPDGSRSLLRSSEAETRTLPGGVERTTRSTSRPDVNGRLQAVERTVEVSTETGPDTREVKKTVLMPDVNGAFSAVERVHQVERKEGGITEVTATHSRPDAGGRWGTYEVRKQTMEETGEGGKLSDERVFRRDLNDRESLHERTVTRTSKDAFGDERTVQETFSRANSGANVAEGSRPPLTQRAMTVTTTQPDGSQRVVESVAQSDPANPGSLHTTGQSLQISTADAAGKQSHRTVRMDDANGGLKDTVVVDFAEKK
ncbi:MAG TPA: hypothetical protein VLE48_10270, partial [Terriglobales bacterium]|nr:hypothetical protein [Terriglobales bacterium]